MLGNRRTVSLAVYRAASDVFGKAAFFAVTVLAARRLSQESFGVFSLGTTLGWIAAVAADFGIQLHTARAVAQHPDQARHILATWSRVRTATSAVAVVVLGAGLLIGGQPARVAVPLFVLALAYVVSGLLEFTYHFFRGLGRSDLESSLTIAQRTATLLLAALVLWLRPTVTWLAVSLLVSFSVTLVVAARIAADLARGRQARASAGAAGTPVPTAASTAAAASLHSAGAVLTMGAGIVLSALYFRIDVFLVQDWGGASAVALYNAVFRIVDALRLLPAAAIAVALPQIFVAADSRPVARLGLSLTAGAAAISAALASIAGWLIPFLYGEAYAPAVGAFQVLLVSFPLMSLNYALTHQLLGWHRPRAYLAICAAALALNVAVNLQTLPRMGIVGAAWATVYTEALITVGCLAALAITRPSFLRATASQVAVL